MKRRLIKVGVILFVGGGLLLRPPPPPDFATPSEVTPFRWDADELFADLQAQYVEVRGIGEAEARSRAAALAQAGSALLGGLSDAPATPLDALTELAGLQFELAVLGAAHPALLSDVESFVLRTRVEVMTAAAAWPNDRPTHEALYRVVFGGRIAMEEALIQAGPNTLPPLVEIEDIPSVSPSIVVDGVRVHSGDILLSRGGAPTSALIARGSDFANTFSHAALAYVDGATGVGTVVESLIETGTVLTTVEEYLERKSHRILVLRLRPDHPAIVRNPLLAHEAASEMFARLSEEAAPYDFAMRWSDASKMFCSEVVAHSFGPKGIDLFPIRSDMTAPGLVRWLGMMGVREFSTLVPSDLEYDAQLRAVIEWRDAGALMDYRLDNAITDVLLERADAGADLGYAWYARPVARIVKGLSFAQEMVGIRPTIPQGMSADAALRVSALVSRVNPTIKAELVTLEEAFFVENGYRAPYWALVELARTALVNVEPELGAALRSGRPAY